VACAVTGFGLYVVLCSIGVTDLGVFIGVQMHVCSVLHGHVLN
jgi:hypothetical protein